MEFDEIKNIWQDSFSDNDNTIEKELIEKTINAKHKTITVLSNLKYSFYFEFVSGILSVIFLILLDSKILNIIFYPMLSIYYFFYIIIIIKFLRLEKKILIEDNILPTLKKFISFFNRFLTRYFNIGIFLSLLTLFVMPFSFALGYYLAAAGIGNSFTDFFNYYDYNFLISFKFLKIFFLGFLGTPIAAYFANLGIIITHVFLKFFYGRHIDNIEKYCKQLEE